jgi:shikimate kinase
MIVLVGFMGAGKTTVGRLLAAKLALPFADSDHVLEDRAGLPVRQYFAEYGEPAFRQLEHEVIAGLLAQPGSGGSGRGESGRGQADGVLALGGGAAAHPATRRLLAAVPVIYLRVSYAEAMKRVGGDTGRPVLSRPDIEQVYAERDALYAAAASCTVDTDARTLDEIVLDVLGKLDQLERA